MNIKRGSIIMVNFGEMKGSVQKGERPAVVIQNDMGNRYSTTTIVAPITGKKKKSLPIHYELKADEYKCLKSDSTILAEQILTISKEQILSVIGHLKVEDSLELNKILGISMNLKNTAS